MKAFVLTLALLTSSACKIAPSDDSGMHCLAVCLAEFVIRFVEPPESFQVLLSGEEFMNLSLACPDGIRAGGPANLGYECTDEGFRLQASDYIFPETLTISVDNGEEQILSPEWIEESLCGTECTSAQVEL